jgi:glycosyltransferase involved in cell wall biosynthesis
VQPTDVLLGYFGFLNESKGGETLIRTLRRLVDEGMPAHLLKIGGRAGTSDPTNRAYADKIDALVQDLELADRVHFTGYVSGEQVSASLRAVDVCVLPYRDGVSFRRGSLMACLAHGRPIVTTYPAVPLPEIEDGRTMRLIEPESPEDAARAVREIVENPPLRSKLESGALALAARFTWDRIAERTVDFFSSLLREDR